VTFTIEAVNSDIRRRVVETIESVGCSSLRGRLRAAAELLGLPTGRVRRYHYGEVRRIEAHEAFQIIKRAEQAKREKFERDRLKFEARRLESLSSAPSQLAWLVPPAMAPLRDLPVGAPSCSGDGETDF
jgi:hypothetical protein